MVLVICYLQRVAKPLRDFLSSFLGKADATFLAPYSADAVKVVVLDAAQDSRRSTCTSYAGALR